jgi:hypothetical protein
MLVLSWRDAPTLPPEQEKLADDVLGVLEEPRLSSSQARKLHRGISSAGPATPKSTRLPRAYARGMEGARRLPRDHVHRAGTWCGGRTVRRKVMVVTFTIVRSCSWWAPPTIHLRRRARVGSSAWFRISSVDESGRSLNHVNALSGGLRGPCAKMCSSAGCSQSSSSVAP